MQKAKGVSIMNMSGGYLGMAGHIWTWIKNNNYPERLQTLCFNCNMAKAHNGYCPHETYYHLRRRRSRLTNICKVLRQQDLLCNVLQFIR